MEFPSNFTELSDNLNYTVSTFNTSYTNYDQLNLPYTVCEILVAICAVFGNGLVIIVFGKEKKLRRRTNYYIISLATADLLVGLFAIPFAILASIGLPTNLHACLFTVSVLVVLCTISIFCLVAVSVDRYWAILHPMGYSRTVRTKTAIGIICVCWITGTLVGFLPLFGWNAGKKSDEKCIFTQVMDYDYLVFLYFATIIFPALLIVAFYALIYRVVVKQEKSPFLDSGVKTERRTSKDAKYRSRLLDGKTRSTGCFQLQQIVTMNPGRRSGGGSISGLAGGTTLATGVTGAGAGAGTGAAGGGGGGAGVSGNHHTTGTMQRFKRDVKATQNLSHIVIFFIICWFPLYTINCVMAFCPRCQVNEFFMNLCIILSHLNSVGNPLLYAYHLKDFREALKNYWRLLFSNGEVKSSVVNVIHERGSLAGSQRQFQRQSFVGTLPIRKERSSLLRQVTDFQAKETSSLSRASSIRDKEERNEPMVSSSSSPSEEKLRSSSEYPLNEDSPSSTYERSSLERSESADTPSREDSQMELQIYKALATVPTSSEVDRSDRFEELPPTSIFIIEADVNRTVSNRDKCEVNSNERQDEGG
ncbi:5-hydroxytryptamine receptor 1D-like isoform X1 [Vespula pensylvanica]|uniref:5-hydroxytryptamine receptor 1D-like isoform X1 n=1 Tax=Vespula pensylvanica TaxID=30213 RepID=UPI001CBA33E1|nr:5-hydroxytryptamine receptor 1D-like isoform X1 [Vespula pensylvanica]